MIAVFARSKKDMDVDIKVFPKYEFVYIESVESVRGRVFTGVVFCYKWHENTKAEFAYDVLRTRQSELFKGL